MQATRRVGRSRRARRRRRPPIGAYAGTLALLVLGRDAEARALASTLRGRDDFPRRRRRHAHSGRCGRPRRLPRRDRARARVVRDADGLPRGRRRRRHSARAAGARRAARRGGRPTLVAAASRLSRAVTPRQRRARRRSCRSRRGRGSRASRATARRRMPLCGLCLVGACDEEQHLVGGAQHRQRQRDPVDEWRELRLRADRTPVGHVERRLLGIERGNVPVGAEAEQHEVEALQLRRAPPRTRVPRRPCRARRACGGSSPA